MVNYFSSSHDLFKEKKQRRNFKDSIKKRVWMKCGNHDPEKYKIKFIKTSYCMNKKHRKKLNWDKKYQFQWDHIDNNPSNDKEKNCGLLCNDCHRKFTKFGNRKIKWMGIVVGNKRIKKKVGYKKQTRKTTTNKKIKKKPIRKTQSAYNFGFRISKRKGGLF